MMKKFTDSLYIPLYRLSIACLLLFSACQNKTDADKKITIRWKNNRAVALVISPYYRPASSGVKDWLQVKLAGNTQNLAILGNITQSEDSIVFEPLIPFTRGLRYQVFVNQKSIGEIDIPAAKDNPKLVAIYPSQDTLPENLLKFYFVFSRPMTEEQALCHIFLTDIQGDTLTGIFLELHPELWDKNNTILTLWLDPGRIKRDLQPNKRLGLPLSSGKQYKLVVSPEWADELGAKLDKDYVKTFWVTDRDEQSPKTNNWQLEIPKAGTQQALKIHFKEPLDYILLQNTIQIVDTDGNTISGKTEITDEDKTYTFTPDKPWTENKYKIKAEARLEDLAGNNLNRLFDTDLQNDKSAPPKNSYEISWQAQK